jgi:hypothetical protein
LGTFISLFFFPAPYGRLTRPHFGKLISTRTGWMVMEAPSALVFFAMYLVAKVPVNAPMIMFLLLWEIHYLHRGFIYPSSRSDAAKPMPLAIVFMGLFFNIGNAYLNGRWIYAFSGGYPQSWMKDPRFLIGVVVFVAGFIINKRADQILRALRKPGEMDYKIPRGSLYEKISCPNYFGEILEWLGWAVATWSLAGLIFAIWTFANLAPRAVSYHQWYKETFSEYPPERKALIPFIW